MIGLARDVPGVVEVDSRITYDVEDGHERPVRLSTSGTRRPIQPHG